MAGRKRSVRIRIAIAAAVGALVITATSIAVATEQDAPNARPEVDAALDFGHPVYTRADIDDWSTSSPEYTRLSGSWSGNVNRTYVKFGTTVDTAELSAFTAQSGYIKAQAVLWAADGKAARRTTALAMLNELRAVTSFQHDSGEQYRLEAAWAATNLAQAASILGYHDAGFGRFLTDVCYPILDWTNGPNWHASFADARLAIAAHVGDADRWADAKAYFDQRIAQSIHHSEHDGSKVRPLLNGNGSPNASLTKSHWGGSWGATQVNSDFTPVDPVRFTDGANAERTRDLAHVSMGLGAWMHGARTILAQRDTRAPHALDRLTAAYAHHGDRVLAYLNTGKIPAPAATKGDGGGSFAMGWFGACALFRADTPASVLALCEHPAVTGSSPTGGNHLIAEAFADGRIE